MVGDEVGQVKLRAPVRNSVQRPASAPRPRSTLPIAAMIWRDARSAHSTLVERWLKSRDLNPAALPGGLNALRYHPACPALWERGRVCLTAPAMVVGMAKIATSSLIKLRGGWQLST
ncbi:DUF7146 domain-containing protein [Iodidimonas gelatinilytica]|uniref:DUF7146 domain-containing protein n=1 Tax=Iodidimonas gelatinilytica TaxID=1236966 RepID=UPI0012315790|nr:hypothetical protein [Iodidimonas gelatinilytica]